MPPNQRSSARRGPHGEPNPHDKPRNARAAWRRLFVELKPFLGLIGLEFFMILAGTVSMSLVPAVLGFATDNILAGKVDRLVQNLVVALGLSIVAVVLGYLGQRINRLVVQRLGYRLRNVASDKVNRLSVSYLESQDTGDLVSRTTNDVDNITQTLQQVLGRALDSLISIVAVTVMMFVISPWLALLTLLILPVVGAGAGFIMKKSQPYFKQQWDQTGVVSTLVEESFSGQQILTLHGLAPTYSQRFARENETFTQASFKAQFISMLMQPMLILVSNLSFVLVAVIGAWFVLSGMMTIGGVQAFIQYSRNFSMPLAAVMQILNLMQSALASAERLFRFIDETDSEIETDRAAQLICGPDPASDQDEGTSDCGAALQDGRIVFDNVTFSYVPGKPVIRDLNLTVEKGQSIAIVGPTGAGKTTLVNLLERYVDPDSGTITMGGLDIRRIPIERLRAEIGMVAQDPWLIDDTIRANIAFGEPLPDPAAVELAATQSGLDSLVKALPAGYDTLIGNDSTALSAGEKQLLTIARAFYADRSILILDEATSAVDTRTELQLAKAMSRLGRGKTTFTIAHRLSTIRGADIILVIDEGRLVESGNHEQLLAQRGAYYQLYHSQFKQA
ncbi:ABC transporter ATP-binding protein [uncultured Mobiluncus sp.]|uniref:ABC transporter ATP-binding protein n=1 Tax=uncultured Mobiluncus sp. TaxID=293425 RepID=UPI0026104658|nr:ABC transporter ATP-binding protein [uncultured Mobiluncus sp.]